MAEDKDWVAGRRPHSEDADYKGLVEVRGMAGYKFVPWSFVPKGVSWRRTEDFETISVRLTSRTSSAIGRHKDLTPAPGAGYDYGSGTNESLLSSYAAGSFTYGFGADCSCDCSCDSSGF